MQDNPIKNKSQLLIKHVPLSPLKYPSPPPPPQTPQKETNKKMKNKNQKEKKNNSPFILLKNNFRSNFKHGFEYALLAQINNGRLNNFLKVFFTHFQILSQMSLSSFTFIRLETKTDDHCLFIWLME